MRIIAFFRPKSGFGPDDFAPHLVDEEIWSWNQFAAGHIRELNSAPTFGGMICLLEFDSVDEAMAETHNIPLFKEGMLDLELHELHPFTNWAILFDAEVRARLPPTPP